MQTIACSAPAPVQLASRRLHGDAKPCLALKLTLCSNAQECIIQLPTEHEPTALPSAPSFLSSCPPPRGRRASGATRASLSAQERTHKASSRQCRLVFLFPLQPEDERRDRAEFGRDRRVAAWALGLGPAAEARPELCVATSDFRQLCDPRGCGKMVALERLLAAWKAQPGGSKVGCLLGGRGQCRGLGRWRQDGLSDG